jgi:hypothetical protein
MNSPNQANVTEGRLLRRLGNDKIIGWICCVVTSLGGRESYQIVKQTNQSSGKVCIYEGTTLLVMKHRFPGNVHKEWWVGYQARSVSELRIRLSSTIR